MINPKGGAGNLGSVGDPVTSPRSRRPGRRSRRPLLLTALGLGLVSTIGSCAVLWLAAHLLTGAPGDGRPLMEGVDLLKVALSVGLSEWTAAVQAS